MGRVGKGLKRWTQRSVGGLEGRGGGGGGESRSQRGGGCTRGRKSRGEGQDWREEGDKAAAAGRRGGNWGDLKTRPNGEKQE